MSISRPAGALFTLIKLLCVLAVAGALTAGFIVPYLAGIGLVSNAATAKFLDSSCHLTVPSLDQTTTMYARDGKTVIAKFFDHNRKPVPLSQISTTVQHALIDTEDRRFLQHHGIDARGLARAALNDSNGDSDTQGASTLTQQLVKQIRLYDAKTTAAQEAATAQTVDRKIYEANCALDLENRYSKGQILDDYFNFAYFGEQADGIYTAAKTYFNVLPSQLTVPQAAVLAGLVKNPTLYDPFLNQKPARQRRDEVIQNMVTAGTISQHSANIYKASPLDVTTTPLNLGAQGCSFANDKAITNVGFFCDYAWQWLTSPTGGGLDANRIRGGGYKIVTSIDPKLQNSAENKLFDGKNSFPADSVSTVIQPAMNPQNGQVTAFITSKHYAYGTSPKKNSAYTSNPIFTSAYAGSGSTYKYFSLIAALQAGIKPEQKLTTSNAYTPTNCTAIKKPVAIRNEGLNPTMDLRTAFTLSSNAFFVGLEDQLFDCNLKTIVDTAVDLGMTSLAAPLEAGSKDSIATQAVAGDQYTFTLGQTPTSALQLTTAYAVAANDGVACAPKPVLSVTDATGATVPFTQPTCTRKMDPWVARTAIDIMKGPVASGTATRFFNSDFYTDVSRSGHAVVGKTGTNNATNKKGEDDEHNSSLWFMGMSPTLASASAIVSIDNPNVDVKIPGVGASTGRETFGVYASKYWIQSFKSTLDNDTWKWDAADQVPDSDAVPSVRGYQEDRAVQRLKDAGFDPVEYPIECGSQLPEGVVAYSGPPVAASGSKIYYCLSNGKSLHAAPHKSRLKKVKATKNNKNNSKKADKKAAAKKPKKKKKK